MGKEKEWGRDGGRRGRGQTGGRGEFLQGCIIVQLNGDAATIV